MCNIKLKAAIIMVMLTVIGVRSADLIVDGPGGSHYASLYDAWLAAVDGDTIAFKAGMTFSGTGNYNILINKELTLTRTGEGEDPIIDLTGVIEYFIKFTKTCTMSHLDIRNKANSNKSVIETSGYYALHIEDCSFRNNAGSGLSYSVISLGDQENLTVERCLFQGNSGGKTGVCGSYYTAGGWVTFKDCIFLNNSSNSSNTGGGVFYLSYINSATICGCAFINNSSTGKSGVMTIEVAYDTSTVECCYFYGNSLPALYCSEANINATNNWWATNNPNFDTLFGTGYSGTITGTPWMACGN